MKTKLNVPFSVIAVALVAFVSSTTAGAVVRLGWERPLFRAEMKVAEMSPDLSREIRDAKSVQLIMTKQDGLKSPSGLMLLIDDQMVEFAIAGFTIESCGTTKYVAQALERNNRFGRSGAKLRLVEHAGPNSVPMCREKFSHRWEASLDNQDEQILMSLVGDPEPVYSIM